MTLEEARRLIWQAERVKLTVLTVYAQPDRAGGYLLIIEPVEGGKQMFPDAMKAQIALAEWSGKDVRENLRYFALGEDGIPMECDAERWKMDSPHRRGIEIPCSPQVTAVIHFVGLASADVHEKAVNLWAVTLNLATEVGSYGTDLFSSFEEAKIFVNEYKAKGCPLRSAFLRFRAEYHRPGGSSGLGGRLTRVSPLFFLAHI
jgi:hypothetical protein